MNREALISTILARFEQLSGRPRTDPVYIELREVMDRVSTALLEDCVAMDGAALAMAGFEVQRAA